MVAITVAVPEVIHGSHVADRRITKEAVPGWVRAWDVRTGAHAWDFHTVPNGTDEYGVDTWSRTTIGGEWTPSSMAFR